MAQRFERATEPRNLADEHRPVTGDAIGYNQAGTGQICELTVEDLLDRRIEKLRLQMKALEDIKGNLSQSFLRSGASRISAVLEL